MWWIVAIVVGLLVLGIFGYRTEQKALEAYLAERESYRIDYCKLVAEQELPDIVSQLHNYRPARNEKVLGFCDNAEQNSDGKKGRILLTNQAFVFESDNRNYRFPLTSVSAVESYLDGILIKRRNGKHVPINTGKTPKFLALVDAYFQRVIA